VVGLKKYSTIRFILNEFLSFLIVITVGFSRQEPVQESQLVGQDSPDPSGGLLGGLEDDEGRRHRQGRNRVHSGNEVLQLQISVRFNSIFTNLVSGL
jgi:hypothetical protein